MLLNTTLKVNERDLKEISMTKLIISNMPSTTHSQTDQISIFLNIATYLDPRYKKLPFLSIQECFKVESSLIDVAK